MPVYETLKKGVPTGRYYVKFDYMREKVFKRLPKGSTRKDGEKLEIKLKHNILFQENGLAPQKNELFEVFAAQTYLPHLEAERGKEAADTALKIIRSALQFVRGKTLRQIVPNDIEKFKAFRAALKTQHGKDRKPSTVVGEISIVSGVFEYGIINDVCEKNPCKRVKKPKFDNTQDRILAWDDEPLLFAQLHGQWTIDVSKMALNTGLRQNDILHLTRFKIDWNENRIVLVQGKTKRKVFFPMNEEVRRIIRSRWNNGSEWLFPSPKTGLPQGSVRHSLIRACERAGIEKVTIKDLRRTYGTRIQGLVDAVTAARMLGHKDLRSLPRYQRAVDKMQEAVDYLANRSNIVALDKEKRAAG